MAVAASRLIPSSKPLQSHPFSPSPFVQMAGSAFQRTVEKKRVVVAKASSVSENVVLERETKGRVGDLVSVLADVADAGLGVFKRKLKRESWQPIQAEMIVESGIINCRFFTLFAVAGSLVGSILCFIEGCFLILKSFYEYFRNMPQASDHQGEVIQLLVEALDFFLVGNAMLGFGMGIYVMFVGSKDMKRNGSSLFGLFHFKRLPTRMDTMQSLSQAKSRIGHSVLMILQAGVMDKLKNVPMATALDLACLAGTIFLSSACIFILSRLSTQKYESG